MKVQGGERIVKIAERKKLLKAILYKVLYKRGKDGMIEIDLYPRIPQIKAIES